MKYRVLGKTGLEVSEIGFGAWAIGGTSEAAGVQWGWGDADEAASIAALHRARELGVNFFDTADVYGNGRSEEVIGKAFGSSWGDTLVASKCGNVVRNGQGGKDWSRKHILWSCEQSLKRLKKDVIDLYQLHNPDVETIEKGDWVDSLESLVREGKIRYYGVSIFLPEEGIAVMKRGAGHALQVGYNALRQEMEAEVLPMAMERSYGIIARVPLYYGLLTGKYSADSKFSPRDHRSHTLGPDLDKLAPRAAKMKAIADNGNQGSFGRWSLRFVLSHPAVSTVISGARNPQQVEQNCSASDGTVLPPDQVRRTRELWQQDAWLREFRAGL